MTGKQFGDVRGNAGTYDYENHLFEIDETTVYVYESSIKPYKLVDEFQVVEDCVGVLSENDFQWQCRRWWDKQYTI